MAACLRGAPGCGLHLQNLPCALTGWPCSLRPGLLNRLPEASRGDTLGAVCLAKEVLTFPDPSGCQGQFGAYSAPFPPAVSAFPHNTEQAAIKWCPKMMVSRAGDYLRRG